jgi:hypothetical protein
MMSQADAKTLRIAAQHARFLPERRRDDRLIGLHLWGTFQQNVAARLIFMTRLTLINTLVASGVARHGGAGGGSSSE